MPLQVELEDFDESAGKMKYRLLSPFEAHFMVDQQNGNVRTVAALEFEKVNF